MNDTCTYNVYIHIWGKYVHPCTSAKSNFNNKYTLYMSKKNLIASNVMICSILTPYHNPTSQSLLPTLLSYSTLQPKTNHLWVCVVCVIWHLFHVRDINYRIEINWTLCLCCLAVYFRIWTRWTLFHFTRMCELNNFASACTKH